MKPIYQPKGRAAEYGDYCVNLYTGCNHGCTYCYARRMHERWNRTPFDQVQPRDGLLEAMEQQLRTGAYRDKLIHLCFTCDPYPAVVDTTITRKAIHLLKMYGCHVQILTKGGNRALRDFDLLDRGDLFGITISGDILREPGAAVDYERVLSLRTAHLKGIRTWASFEPVFNEQTVYRAIRDNDWVDIIRIGKLNYQASEIHWGDFGRECERIARQYGRTIHIKADLRKEMGQ